MRSVTICKLGVLAFGLMSLLGATSHVQAAVIFTVGNSAGTANANSWPAAESPPNAVDNNTATKYLNFAKLNTGYLITPTSPGIATGLNVSTANDALERDPTSYIVYGSNTATANLTAGTTYQGSDFTLISSGTLTPPATRLTAYPGVTFSNSTSYNSYLVLFPTVLTPGSANSMQLSEANLVGISGAGAVVTGGLGDPTAVPEPASLTLLGLGLIGFAARRRKA